MYSGEIMNHSNVFNIFIEPNIFTKIRATHDYQHVKLSIIFCLGKDGMCYLAQWNQVHQEDPVKLV